jgi:high frequency lysogenization protein
LEDRRTHEQVVSLAGLFQAVSLVQQVARESSAEPAPFETSIASVFRIDADSTEAVYGGSAGLRRGLQTLCRQLGRQKSRQDAELMRYAVSLLFLERKLVSDRALMEVLRTGIESASDQVDHYPVTHENVIANLADIYSNTVSTLEPRIMVQGTPEHLNNPANANRIRALLLAGMRSAVLWRQLGGNRVRLLLARRKIVACATELLEERPT